MSGVQQLSPTSQFPTPAINQSVQIQPPPQSNVAVSSLVFALASSADSIIPWGTNVLFRDQQLRQFWPSESYLAGAINNASSRNSVYDFEIQGPSQKIIQVVTDMLHAMLAGDTVGWIPGTLKLSQDLYTQDNGAFIELIRDPSVDSSSKFRGALAPVIGIAHLDSGKCQRTGNAEYPVLYEDREGRQHKLAWYEVIPFADFPSAIERMNGVGYCGVTRALRLAQIMRSIAIFKDENVSGRNVKRINIVGGVGNQQLEDAVKLTTENANNIGNMRFIEHAILASLDPEKPVTTAVIDLATLPEGFNYDQEMQWYISGLALDFGLDYQDLAPLPGGNIGSGAQSSMLHRKSSGKGPRVWMDTIANAFRNYGVLPRGYKMVFNDKNEQEELEKQEVRTKSLEEVAIAVRSKILTPEAGARELVRRGVYSEETIKDIPEEFWKQAMQSGVQKQPVGGRGGNTIREDSGRVDSGKEDLIGSGRLTK